MKNHKQMPLKILQVLQEWKQISDPEQLHEHKQNGTLKHNDRAMHLSLDESHCKMLPKEKYLIETPQE